MSALTYASRQDFLDMKNADKTGIITVSENSNNRIDTYLSRATKYIEHQTRRSFFPFREERTFPIPYQFNDLSLKRYPSAHLTLDQDLLEVITVNNGIEDIESNYYFTLEHNVYPKHILAIKFPKYWGGVSSISTRYDEAVVTLDAIWGYAEHRYPSAYWLDTGQTIPVGGIDNSQTTFDVNDATVVDDSGTLSFTANRLIRVNNEFMHITGVSGSTLTVKRGVRGTVKEAHDENTLIERWNVQEDIIEVCLQIAKTWREADIAAGGRIGVSDVSVGVELGIPNDPLEILKSYRRSLILD